MKKNDLLAEYNTIQIKCKALEDEKKIFIDNQKKHIEAINLLEETVNVLQAKLNAMQKAKCTVSVQTDDTMLNEIEKGIKNANGKTSSTQTEDVDFMRCEDWEYPAQDICDLGAHIFQYHVSQHHEKLIKCYFCDEKFESKGSLMIHRKKTHKEKVNICWKFLDQNCEKGDEDCWYLHKKPEVLLKCTFCEKEFNIKQELMKHRKSEHKEYVKVCKNSKERSCKFNESCWYIHEKLQDEKFQKNSQEILNVTNDEEIYT